MTARSPDSGSAAFRLLFGLAFVVHVLLVTHNFSYGFLIGHEFRQAQTAIITRYIDQQNNFSLRYETPILGKPWECPLEFPLYQWTVVGVSRALGVPHFMAARGVSIACFWLALPGVWLLLREWGMGVPRRWVTLALLVTCPVFIHYSRSFLMEAMALLFAVWFLTAFVLMLRRRQWRWLAVCALCGTAAGLVKSLTFAVWGAPAAVFGAWSLCSDWRRGGWRAATRTASWGLGVMIVPTTAAAWWVGFTDAIKAGHPSAHIFTAKALSGGNYAAFNLVRFQPGTWNLLMDRWREALMAPLVLGAILAVGLVLGRQVRGKVLAAAGCFFFAQMLFPLAYAYQEYYFFACGAFLAIAFGFVLEGVFSTGWPRWLKWLAVALPLVAQAEAYHRFYWPMVRVKSHGGTGLTAALRDFTPPWSILVVAGDDWSAIIPYNSERKALMIRSGLEFDGGYLDRAFGDLRDEFVSALVLTNDCRSNLELVRRAVQAFGVDSRPTFSHSNADVYLHPLFRGDAIETIRAKHQYEGVSTVEEAGDLAQFQRVFSVSPPMAAVVLPMVSPAPAQFRFNFGFGTWLIGGRTVLKAHPDTDLWVPVPPGPRLVAVRYGLIPEVEKHGAGGADGVEFAVSAEDRAGNRRELFSRWVNPVLEAEDRGTQSFEFAAEVNHGETLVFTTRPVGNLTCDWAYWERIEVR